MKKNNDFQPRENEEIIAVVYHHLIIVLPHVVVALLILILDFFLMYFLFLQGWWGAGLFLAIIVLALFYVLRLFFLYRKNRFVITSQRIIDFEQPGFFEKFVNEFPLSKIIEVKAVVKGIAPTIFRYGNLKLVLAENLGPFELYKIAEPAKLQYLINELRQKNQRAERSFKPNCMDSISLVMAEIALLSADDKEEVIRRTEQLLLENHAREKISGR